MHLKFQKIKVMPKKKDISTHTIITSNVITMKSITPDKKANLTTSYSQQIVLLFCFATLTLLALIPFLQIIPSNINLLCRYEFFNQNLKNILNCKHAFEIGTRKHNTRWVKRLSETPSYFYDSQSLEAWGRDDDDKTFNSKYGNFF